ncbi:Ankyrin repeats-containing protein [Cardinium endosymbiont cBtQ1 of Bemisia tabaci]|nr:Ankyrin repeats-containing protein [Cardinium endosymbiont cBtQ1 of Bemisia tabaci]
MEYLPLFIMICSFLTASNCRQRAAASSELIPLMVAVKNSEFEKVCGYLHGGADPNVQDRYGNTVLHWAGYCDKDGLITKQLLEKGAKVDALDRNHFTPLDWAYKKGHILAMKALIQKAMDLKLESIPCQHRETLLHWAAKSGPDKGSNEMVAYLLQLGLNPNQKDKDGRTPLHYAVGYGNIDVVQVLLDGGARTDLQDKDRRVPLDCAQRNDIVVQLLLHG